MPCEMTVKNSTACTYPHTAHMHHQHMPASSIQQYTTQEDNIQEP
jgi:hypothetical protein